MSNIAIKDLNEDTTLDQAAMSELYGGKGGHCPPGELGLTLPRSNQHENKRINSLDLGQMGAGVAEQIGELVANIGPICGPPGQGIRQ
ncbi:MAG: hypothetical protein ACR2P1_29080 [Pseudomonadales bacterium]